MIVVPVAPGDVDEIAAIERASFSDPWSTDAFEVMVARPHVRFLAARDAAGAPVLGYVVAIFAGGEGEIANLAVAGGARRRGIGRLLVEAVVQAARSEGVEAVYLEVREGNSAARKLYRTAGFADAGRRRGYYQRPAEDALILKREVQAGLT